MEAIAPSSPMSAEDIFGKAGLEREAEGKKGVVSSVLLLHSESYPPGQYVRLAEMNNDQEVKPLIVAKTFKIDELREIKNIELTIELRDVCERSR